MDIETGRQMYFLGKLVKKATRAVKKVVKSPIGIAALLYGLGSYGLGKGLFGGMKGAGFLKGNLMKNLFTGGKDLAFKNLTGSGAMLGIAGISALAGLMPQEEEEDDPYRGPDIDIANIRANPYNFLAPRFTGTTFAAEGGRMGYQEGSKEPVASKTMPLLDMDGKEMDLRDNGGFVPIGRMEKADDVPARLS